MCVQSINDFCRYIIGFFLKILVTKIKIYNIKDRYVILRRYKIVIYNRIYLDIAGGLNLRQLLTYLIPRCNHEMVGIFSLLSLSRCFPGYNDEQMIHLVV